MKKNLLSLILTIVGAVLVLQFACQKFTKLSEDEWLDTYSNDIVALQLLSLTTGTLDPTFDVAVFNYSATVSYSTSTIGVTAVLQDINSSLAIQINGGGYESMANASTKYLALNAGTNTVSIQVTAQNGKDTGTYSIQLTRQTLDPSNNYLSNLTPSEGTLVPSFVKTDTEYSVFIDNDTASLYFIPVKESENATIQYRKVPNAFVSIESGQSTGAISVVVGTTTFEFKVIAENLSERKYTVGVTRGDVERWDDSGLTWDQLDLNWY